MRIKQTIVGLVLLLAPVAAHAGWRGHRGPHDAPPPPIEEHARTRSGYVWANGYHDWRHGHYVWVSGHLVRAHRGRDWEDGRWERHDDHYDWHDGGWRPHR